jgi:hypothetical protein
MKTFFIVFVVIIFVFFAFGCTKEEAPDEEPVIESAEEEAPDEEPVIESAEEEAPDEEPVIESAEEKIQEEVPIEENNEGKIIDINPIILSSLGINTETLFSVFGAPDGTQKHGGPGGVEYYYKELKIVFVDAGGNGIINNLLLLHGFQFSPEIKIGENNLEEIIEEVGPNEILKDSYLSQYGGELYTSYVFFLGEKYVELWFMENEEGKTSCSVLWKGYWDN